MLPVVVAAGCGEGSSTPVDSGAIEHEVEHETSGKGDDKFIEGDEGKTPDEKGAAREALDYVLDANAGSEFRVTDIAVADGWARAVVEEVNIPAEEAIGFDIYLQKVTGGDREWEVAKTGTGVSPDDLPGAPPEIFKP